MEIKGNNVLIVGGASGIGRIMGRMSVEKGAASVSIWDVNDDNIRKVASELESISGGRTRIFGHHADVSDYAGVENVYRMTVSDTGQVDIIINCAGIVTSNKLFRDNSPEEIERTLRINTLGSMYVALAALGDMVARDKGHICNIASAAGMVSNPRMSAYAASKWAVIGWSDSVRIELAEMHSGVRFTTVAPYYINTGMFDGVRSRILPILNPEKTSAKILRAIEKNAPFKGLPFSFHFIRFWQGLLPTKLFDWFFGQVFGIYHTMDNFTGRK